MDKARKKNIKRIVAAVCIAVVVALLAVMPLFSRKPPEQNGPKASILSGTVAMDSIDTKIVGGGTLTEETAVPVSVPAAVKLKEYLVANGDAVTAGEAIATVDRVTAMKAMAEVQETLDYLAQQIEKNSEAVSQERVTALAGGTVKLLYAKEGDSVQDVMLTYGALAVLSLDGKMAVDLETESTLSAGTAVTVTFDDGTEAAGEVAVNLNGQMTVTVEDRDYAVGAAVAVTDEDDQSIGTGELYIYSPWNAIAYAGTVGQVEITEGQQLEGGAVLMTLTDVGNTATYGQLVVQRQKYEALMEQLMQMYRTETVIANSDGIISGLDDSSTQLLSNSKEELELEEEDSSSAMPGFGSGSMEGGFGNMGGMGSMGGNTTQTTFELYDLTANEIAAVTPQSVMTVEITVDEQDITTLQVGMEAQLRIDALGGQKYTAQISQISNTGTNNGGSSKFTVELMLQRGENMLSGMTATATVVLSTEEDVLTVPAEALVEQGNETVVYTGYDEGAQKLLNPVTVKVGSSDGKTVEILEGLAKGQTYYYAYYDTLEISFTPNFGGGSFFG